MGTLFKAGALACVRASSLSLLGWLFGSFTVLRWRRLTVPVLLQRLLITAVLTLMVVAIARWLINPSEMVWLVYRRVQFLWIGSLSLWVLAVRVGLRRGLLLPDVTSDSVARPALGAGYGAGGLAALAPAPAFAPCCVNRLAQQLDQADDPILLALSQAVRPRHSFRPLLASFEMRDPRQLRVISVLSLFEQQQERLPPALMNEHSAFL